MCFLWELLQGRVAVAVGPPPRGGSLEGVSRCSPARDLRGSGTLIARPCLSGPEGGGRGRREAPPEGFQPQLSPGWPWQVGDVRGPMTRPHLALGAHQSPLPRYSVMRRLLPPIPRVKDPIGDSSQGDKMVRPCGCLGTRQPQPSPAHRALLWGAARRQARQEPP